MSKKTPAEPIVIPEPAPALTHIKGRFVGVVGDVRTRRRGGFQFHADTYSEYDVTAEQLQVLEADTALEIRYEGKKRTVVAPPVSGEQAELEFLRKENARLTHMLQKEQQQRVAEVRDANTNAEMRINRMRASYDRALMGQDNMPPAEEKASGWMP